MYVRCEMHPPHPLQAITHRIHYAMYIVTRTHYTLYNVPQHTTYSMLRQYSESSQSALTLVVARATYQENTGNLARFCKTRGVLNEGYLVAFEINIRKSLLVPSSSQCHSLFPCSPCGVPNSHVFPNESRCNHRCINKPWHTKLLQSGSFKLINGFTEIIFGKTDEFCITKTSTAEQYSKK